ncbi:LacI family DNA-binding transcriptional regulator [Kiritimatiellaeota bacterium B1221]|nr:LacI family DNA-binding transcriptional regulator [Kiritimatiellaeota bacterium B1221]
MKNRVTQRDIAKEAGVDVSTVCLCLNGHPRISEETRDRVRAIAERLGYRPDPALSAIAASRWSKNRSDTGRVLAFVADDLQAAEPELKLYLRGVCSRAEALGYRVEPFSLRDYPSAEALNRVIRARGIRGMILGQSRHELPLELFDQNSVPEVHCGYLRDVPGDMVRPDLRMAMSKLLENLLQNYERIVCFLPVEKELRSDQVLLGAALAHARMAPRGRIRVLTPPPIFSSGSLDKLQKWMPDAVVTINELQSAKLQTETALGDAVIHTLHTLPPFTGKQGADLRLEDVGRASVSLLELKLRHQPLADESYGQNLLVEPSLLL